MRTTLALVSTIGAACLLAASPARAEIDYPVCLHVYGPITYDDCSYTTMEQCRPQASGRPAQCLINPFYGTRSHPSGNRRKARSAD